MTAPDRRRTPWRPDLAAAHLKGQLAAERYVDGVPYQVCASRVGLRAEPDTQCGIDTEVLFGEQVTVYDRSESGWVWGQSAVDDYVGWAPARFLSMKVSQPTHKISIPRTFVYPDADLKHPSDLCLSLQALVTVRDIVKVRDLDYAVLADGRAVIADHLRPVSEYADDFISVARLFINTPYLWGGRTSLGLDCSALVQLALAATGVSVPRDSDMQAAELGELLPAPWRLENTSCGDLVFWTGHVGIVTDGAHLLHASGHHMMVVEEPLEPAVARIAATGSEITAIRRVHSG